MAKRRPLTGMTQSERLLGGVLLLLYLVVLPLTADRAFGLVEQLMGWELGEDVRNAAYYYVIFALTVLVFGSFLARATRDFLSPIWSVLGSACLGLVAFFGLGELSARVLGLVLTEQANLNDAAISAKVGAAPYSTAVIVVLLAPFVEETLFRGYLFGNIREFSRPAAYAVSSLLFALLHVWQFAAVNHSWTYLLQMLQYLVPGLVMAWTYERSGTLWGSVLFHAAVNGLAVAALL